MVSGLARRGALLGCLVWALPALALDNPDAPDRVAAFEARAQPLALRVNQAAGGSDAAAAAQAYEAFLEQELNQAYQGLLGQLGPASRRELVAAQRRWLQWREAETRFIQGEFTAARFGSSSALSRAGYRASLVRQRTVALLHYQQNYPANEAADVPPR